MRRLLSSPAHPLGSRHLLLLELTGRRTGSIAFRSGITGV